MQIKKLFSDIPDPRINRCKKHLLEDILLLTLIAVLCGVEGYEDIELFGKTKIDFLRQIMELPNGIPSHDTIERLLKRIDSKAFEDKFIQWADNLAQKTNGRIISIDGKTVRGSHDKFLGKFAIHLVSAWCNENSMMLGQIKTDCKSNEIKAAQELLELIDIKGSIVTLDAMGCQKKTVQEIVEKEADYILSVKLNQEKLYHSVSSSFSLVKPSSINKTIEKDHGRIETRVCEVINNLRWVENPFDWTSFKTIIKIESSREIQGEVTTETRYNICSLAKDAAYFNQAIRQHWHIENKFHWALDVQFDEDKRRKRKDNSAENFAIIRRVALQKVSKAPLRRLGIKGRRHYAGWDNEYLMKLILI